MRLNLVCIVLCGVSALLYAIAFSLEGGALLLMGCLVFLTMIPLLIMGRRQLRSNPKSQEEFHADDRPTR